MSLSAHTAVTMYGAALDHAEGAIRYFLTAADEVTARARGVFCSAMRILHPKPVAYDRSCPWLMFNRGVLRRGRLFQLFHVSARGQMFRAWFRLMRMTLQKPGLAAHDLASPKGCGRRSTGRLRYHGTRETPLSRMAWLTASLLAVADACLSCCTSYCSPDTNSRYLQSREYPAQAD